MMKPTRVRGPLQRIFDLLRSIREPTKKAHILQRARLDDKTFAKYLLSLLERGLVEEVPYVTPKGWRIDKRTPCLYVVTDKGEVLIELFQQIYDILGWSVKE